MFDLSRDVSDLRAQVMRVNGAISVGKRKDRQGLDLETIKRDLLGGRARELSTQEVLELGLKAKS